jgi:predicted signal transduction protein with EAL and GGDEF domain
MHTAQFPNLYNENVFRLLMDYEIRRSQRYVSPLCLLRLAIVMDHPTAQEIQNAPAVLNSILNSRLRAADLPAKIGGEYAVLLPVTDEAGGRALCERLLIVSRGTHQVDGGPTARLSLCIGMTSHPGGPSLRGDLLTQEAETALAKARQHGPQSYVVFSKITN